MVEPKDEAGPVPPNQEKHEGNEQVSIAPALNRESNSSVAQNQANDAEKESYIGKKLRQSWMQIKKFLRACGEYFWHMFLHEKSAFWTMVFTAVLTYFTCQLVRVTDKVDETTRTTQRAFVTQSNVVHGGKMTENGKWKNEILLVNWENSGNTPIWHGVLHTEPHELTSELPEGFDFSDTGNESRNIYIGARDKAQTGVVMPVAYFDQAKTGKAHIFVWGWLRYRDIFFPKSPQHVHEFCVELMNVKPDPTDPTGTDIIWVTANCAEHNCDDEDCADYKTHLK